ncbi:progonadoliberin-2 [Hippopotamus amphibius kiboko]|uniref:progonadoliberin-2 n=1 Tax=Hippopotamus amphibius kiboko TaxID=575201 RepID=UPI0025941D6A|nr:progonadoliberin-2 [Hippopotamus amphibius kiboko]
MVHGSSPAMASFGLCLLLLLLLLLTTHPGPSKAQHWSHGSYPGGNRASSSPQNPQHTPGPPAHSPGQTAHSLPSNVLAPHEDSVPRLNRTMDRWLLRGKQHLAETLLPVERGEGCDLTLCSRVADNQVVIDMCPGNDSVIAELPKANSGRQV